MAEYLVGDELSLLSDAVSGNPHSPTAIESFRARYADRIRSLAWRLALDHDSLDDLVQEGNLALTEALSLFDNTRGACLSTFIYQRVQSRMLHWRRKQCCALSLLNPNVRRRLRSLDEHIETRDEGRLTYHEVVAADQDLPSENVHFRLIAGFVRNALAKLACRQAEALRLRFWEELSPSEIAERLGVSRPRATVLVQTGIANLRGELAVFV